MGLVGEETWHTLGSSDVKQSHAPFDPLTNLSTHPPSKLYLPKQKTSHIQFFDSKYTSGSTFMFGVFSVFTMIPQHSF